MALKHSVQSLAQADPRRRKMPLWLRLGFFFTRPHVTYEQGRNGKVFWVKAKTFRGYTLILDRGQYREREERR